MGAEVAGGSYACHVCCNAVCFASALADHICVFTTYHGRQPQFSPHNIVQVASPRATNILHFSTPITLFSKCLRSPTAAFVMRPPFLRIYFEVCIFFAFAESVLSRLSVLCCILGNYGHAWSQGGRQPAPAKPPLSVYMLMFWRVAFLCWPTYVLSALEVLIYTVPGMYFF